MGRHRSRSVPSASDAFDCIDSFERAQGAAEVGDIVAKGVAAAGCECFMIACFSRDCAEYRRGVLVSRIPEEWRRYQFERRESDINALQGASLMRGQPIAWNEMVPDAGLERRRRRLTKEGREFGLRNGLCIPLYGPNGETAIANFSGYDIDDSAPTRLAMHVMAIGAYFRLWQPAGWDNRMRAVFTPREVDCLSWVAQGKTDWEIGEILHLRESTVHGYVEAAKHKLGVVTRMQAVVGAIRVGAISP
jgi:DNA-binding CsgD family transcriptional regulator